jgi:tRNA pseudouridine32 synthase/23S rRNA pseudouridine746 synthase/23S rRNA pseudouridine1911/1915/1917 synthase
LIPILYTDEHLLVADKPAGLLTVPLHGDKEADLVARLAEQGERVIPVHRLDREVSGAVLFARNAATREALEGLFRARAVEKTYWALAAGKVRPKDGEWKFPILEEGSHARISALGQRSITRYRTLEALPSSTALEIDLITGRRNQIRLHAAHAGHPLIGERKYARGKDSPLRLRSRRVALHAWKLSFPHPATGTELSITAPLPADLSELLERARKG